MEFKKNKKGEKVVYSYNKELAKKKKKEKNK